MSHLIKIHPADSVAVALSPLSVGEPIELDGLWLVPTTNIAKGHKVALRRHEAGEAVWKYGCPIGRTKRDVEVGEHVHTHNLESALSTQTDLEFEATARTSTTPLAGTFRGFERDDGRVGTRNELWIVPTVGCVAKTAESLARAFEKRLRDYPNVEGVYAFSHAYGCSQLGNDLENTQKILAALATHPNAAGTLVLGLGCESNHMAAFRPHLESSAASRLRFLSTQDESDEFEAGMRLLDELALQANQSERVELPLSRLTIGLKCGGSDGLSGITANPLLGRFSTALVAAGGSAILTEVPEMFGAEAVLFQRCVDEKVFEQALAMVNRFRRYFTAHGQPVDENPSPGNKEGGISSLEEKSLGCVQKGGQAPITSVIPYGGKCTQQGLTLLDGPGNDPVSTTALVAAGATVVLFTTGRGTPLGSPVPTLKVASNSELAAHKPGWIDFDAGALAEGVAPSELDAAFAAKVLATASGERTKNEERGYRDIAIFKTGVTL